jgi:long-chain acyl-CoA synthetase
VGDTIDPAVLAFFRAIGVSLHKLYGTTETGYLDALLADARGAAADALGKPLPGSEIALSPEGEILIRSDGMFLGYLGDPEARARAVNAEGWFRSGDSGAKGADGAIVLRDRMSDIGRFADGSPFSPKQVERRLVAQPEIGEAVAVAAGPEGVCALIHIDAAVLGRWADAAGIANNGHSDLAALPEVAAVVGAAVARVNEALARDGLGGHRIARFALLPDPLTPASGLLTPTGKLRRAAVQQRFAAAIAGMAAGRPQAEAPAAEGGLRPIALHEAEPGRGGGTRRVA